MQKYDMILGVQLRDRDVKNINSIVLKLERVRIGHKQNKAEKVVKADNNQNFIELCLKRGLF